MRRTRLSVQVLLVSSFLGASEDSALFSTDTEQVGDFLGCPDPASVCELYHPGSKLTAYCGNDMCLEMSFGEEVRIVAADERGDFPKTWFAWHEGTMTTYGYDFSCSLTESGHKTRVEIPDVSTKCGVDLHTIEYPDSGGPVEHLYHEHFGSNPASGCLGWVECMQW